MTEITPMTELEAVNAMLDAIGEAPVNTLTNSGLADADLAYQILQRTTRQVQSIGWRFNSESSFPLPIDVNGFVNLPSNTLRVAIGQNQSSKYDVVQRGMRLYDRQNHTYVFPETLQVDIILLFTFTDMPEAARSYVAIKAGRMFLDRVVGSADLHGFQEKDELEAWGILTEAEGDSGDYNLLTGSYDVFRTIDRLSPDYLPLIVQ